MGFVCMCLSPWELYVSGCLPYQKLGVQRSRVTVYITAAMPFFESLVKCFPATLGCSDWVYDEISIVPTKLIKCRVEISLKKSYEISNLALDHSISNFPPNFEYVNIVWFGWNLLHRFILEWYLWRLHFFFLEIPPPSLSPNFEHFPIWMKLAT